MSIRMHHFSLYPQALLILDRGGDEVVLDKAGQDASAEFDDVGHSEEAWEALEPLLIGRLKEAVIMTELLQYPICV